MENKELFSSYSPPIMALGWDERDEFFGEEFKKNNGLPPVTSYGLQVCSEKVDDAAYMQFLDLDNFPSMDLSDSYEQGDESFLMEIPSLPSFNIPIVPETKTPLLPLKRNSNHFTHGMPEMKKEGVAKAQSAFLEILGNQIGYPVNLYHPGYCRESAGYCTSPEPLVKKPRYNPTPLPIIQPYQPTLLPIIQHYPPMGINPLLLQQPPAAAQLSQQMAQAFSGSFHSVHDIYDKTKNNIKNKLNDVLPKIAKLDEEYQTVCKSFSDGRFPAKPAGLTQELMPYQWRGFQWMKIFYEHGVGGCLGDEMGLGKTIQSIALIQEVINEKKIKGENFRILICCPPNLIANWRNELISKSKNLHELMFLLEGKEEPGEQFDNICFISHQKFRLNSSLNNETTFPFNQEWDLVIFDEFHTFLKSSKSQKAVTAIRQKAMGENRGFFGLTGTPMPNNLLELHALNDMLNPGVFPPKKEFKFFFMDPAKLQLRGLLQHVLKRKGTIDQDYPLKKLGEYVVQLIEILTKPFLLRRLKNQEEFKYQTAMMKGRSSIDTVPPLASEQLISYPFTTFQMRLINSISSPNEEQLLDNQSVGALSLFDVQAKKDDDSIRLSEMTCLQQVADHPKILSEVQIVNLSISLGDPAFPDQIKEIKVDYAEEGKLQSIFKLVQRILEQYSQDKILIFTNYQKMGEHICKGLQHSELSPTMKKIQFLYGKVNFKMRQEIIREFHSVGGPPVLVLGRKLGNVGLNLTAANHVIFVDQWWNHNDDAQCLGRSARIGQKKVVHPYRLHRPDFIADEIMKKFRIEKKTWCDLILSSDTTNMEQQIRQIVEGIHKIHQ